MKQSFLSFCVWVLLVNAGQAQEAQAPSIKIGVVYAFTGIAQVWSEYGRMGLELAQDEINGAGGINGRPIELIFEDSKSNPAQSVAAYRKLVTVDKVTIVLGNIWAHLTNPLIPLAPKDGVILLSPTTTQESVSHTNGNFFTMGESIESISGAVDTFFRINKEIKTIGILCSDDTWGQAYLKTWTERAAANGVKVEAASCTVDAGNDFRADVARMAAKKVDAVFIAYMGEVILRRMKEQRFAPKVLATSNIVEDIKTKNAPAEIFEGVFITDWKPSDAFLAKFRGKFGRDAVVEAHNSYEALRSIAKALRQNETDPIASLRTVAYEGVAGPIDFSRSSFANHSLAQLYRVRNGEVEPVQ